jgi:hypothetical protein
VGPAAVAARQVASRAWVGRQVGRRWGKRHAAGCLEMVWEKVGHPGTQSIQ